MDGDGENVRFFGECHYFALMFFGGSSFVRGVRLREGNLRGVDRNVCVRTAAIRTFWHTVFANETQRPIQARLKVKTRFSRLGCGAPRGSRKFLGKFCRLQVIKVAVT